MKPSELFEGENSSLRKTFENTRNEVDELQEIVEGYFKNVLKLPCPDFRYNLKK